MRAEPNGFRVHLLNRSDTLSWLVVDHACLESKHKESSHEVERLPAPEASGARVCSCRSCAEKWQFWAGREVGQGFSCLKRARRLGLEQATARGFEPLRAEANGFRVHLLNRSDTLSLSKGDQLAASTENQPESPRAHGSPSNQLRDFGKQALVNCGVWMPRSSATISATC